MGKEQQITLTRPITVQDKGRYRTIMKLLPVEIEEVREILSRDDMDDSTKKKTDAIHRLTSYRALGIDVRPLFVDVIKTSITNNKELKRLIYTFLLSACNGCEDICILMYGSLNKDCCDRDPVVRCFALHTATCLTLKIRFSLVNSGVKELINRALRDSDASVRKTAIYCASLVLQCEVQNDEDEGVIEVMLESLRKVSLDFAHDDDNNNYDDNNNHAGDDDEGSRATARAVLEGLSRRNLGPWAGSP
eukprot:TRINITY_DN10821_c1_g2_i1.p1 TRINITY_DN10821_c1_g2~~TRINITY_DN10821_c1_g2_i1.p1  ORF type:complete len:248 (+),score=63.06 TRINITY_DN10821_c1_g2_i1:101-844(+)